MSILSNIDFITILKPLAVVVGGWLAKKAGDWFTAKTGIEVDKRLAALLDMAIDKAEEWARKEAKQLQGVTAGVLGRAPDHRNPTAFSNQKLQHAVDFVMAEAKRRGLPKMASGVVKDLVEARVQALRKAVNAVD